MKQKRLNYFIEDIKAQYCYLILNIDILIMYAIENISYFLIEIAISYFN